MLLFGGESLSTFKFDLREVDNAAKTAVVKTSKSKLNFNYNRKVGVTSDFVIKTHNNWVYWIDASEKYLHVYSIRD